MKTIIVPLDFSKESLTGLNYSLMLANKTGADIKMVHVVEKNESSNHELLEKEHQLVNSKFEDLHKIFKEKSNSNGSINYIVKEGKIFKEITELAEQFEDSLIVLSTHGASGFEELFIGGNAYKITSHSKVPVITVRKSRIYSNINKIVLPLDITFQTREKAHLLLNWQNYLIQKFN